LLTVYVDVSATFKESFGAYEVTYKETDSAMIDGAQVLANTLANFDLKDA
jgi:hypothetical protein